MSIRFLFHCLFGSTVQCTITLYVHKIPIPLFNGFYCTTNSNVYNPYIYMQPDGLKFGSFDITEFIVWYIYNIIVIKIKGLENKSLSQRLNSLETRITRKLLQAILKLFFKHHIGWYFIVNQSINVNNQSIKQYINVIRDQVKCIGEMVSTNTHLDLKIQSVIQ